MDSARPKYDKDAFEKFLNDVDNAFAGPTNTQELLTYANELLFNQPIDLRVSNVCGTDERFKVNLESSISNSGELDTFISTFETNNNLTLRIATDKTKTLTERSKYSDVRYYRCQHKTRCVSTRDVMQIKTKNPAKRKKKYQLSLHVMC